jgi:hypothetical protein
LADLKKNENSVEAERLKAQLESAQLLTTERQKLHDRISESEKSTTDRIAQAYRDALQAAGPHVVYPPPGSGPVYAPPPPPMPRPQPGWYVGSSDHSVGDAQLKQQIQAKQVAADTLVWKAGMSQWKPAAQMPELAAFFPPAPPVG